MCARTIFQIKFKPANVEKGREKGDDGGYAFILSKGGGHSLLTCLARIVGHASVSEHTCRVRFA